MKMIFFFLVSKHKTKQSKKKKHVSKQAVFRVELELKVV